MAVTANSVVTPQTPNRDIVRFVGTTDGTATLKVLTTAPANGCDIVGLFATNGATAHNVSVVITNSATNYTVNDVAVGANAGQNGTVVPVNFLSSTNWPGLPVDANGNPFLRLISGDTLQISYVTAQGTGDTLYVVATRADY